MKILLPAISFFILFVASVSHAQEKKDSLITGVFENQLLVDFFRQLEAKSPYFFYYSDNQLDSIRVTITAQNESIRVILDKALANTGLLYSIDNNKKVYITRGLKLVTTLPAGIFREPGEGKPTAPVTRDSIIDYGPGGRKEKVTSESKLYEIGTKTNT